MSRSAKLLIVCMTLAIAVGLTGCAEIAKELPNAIKDAGKPPLVTPEEFAQIKVGMKEADVTKIVGAPPTESQQSLDNDTETELQWVNPDGSILFVTIRDGFVTEIKDYDLAGKPKE